MIVIELFTKMLFTQFTIQRFEIRSGVRQGCSIAPSLFLPPTDWVLERTEHKGLGLVFTDLDFADTNQDSPVSSAYILPVLLYGAETWTLTTVLSKQIDSFDLWCQRRILHVHYSHHISNCEIRNRTGCTPATDIIRCRRLQLFGQLQGLNLKWTCTVVLYVLLFEDRLLTGNDCQVVIRYVIGTSVIYACHAYV